MTDVLIDEDVLYESTLTLENVEKGWRALLDMLMNTDKLVDGEGVYYLAEPLCSDLSKTLVALKSARRKEVAHG